MAGKALDLRFVMVDIGKNQVAQRQEDAAENKIQRNDCNEQPADCMLRDAIGRFIGCHERAPYRRQGFSGTLNWIGLVRHASLMVSSRADLRWPSHGCLRFLCIIATGSTPAAPARCPLSCRMKPVPTLPTANVSRFVKRWLDASPARAVELATLSELSLDQLDFDQLPLVQGTGFRAR
ncbi:MAG: hypothetical protein RJA80_597 [Actinomycetota bacterium]